MNLLFNICVVISLRLFSSPIRFDISFVSRNILGKSLVLMKSSKFLTYLIEEHLARAVHCPL